MNLFQERNSSDDIVQDLRDIYNENYKTQIYISEEVYKKLKLSEGIYPQDISYKDSPYKEGRVKFYQKMMNNRSPICSKATDTIGIFYQSKNIFLIVYFQSDSLYCEEGNEVRTNQSVTERMVLLK